jgi:predicted short-subunit dehydrogenase-like oxidoreductase (DUF2520 family)
VAIVGAGSLASFLAPALAQADYTVAEMIARGASQSQAHARAVAAKVGARAVTVSNASLDTGLLWFCVPDREISRTAAALAKNMAASMATRLPAVRFAFHSSGALLSGELEALRKVGFAVASVHPLMTFVPGARPSLQAVPFALEGDAAATKLARRIVSDLGGESFRLPARRKAAYHAWATMTSPLLLAYLVTLEEAAREAGLRREDARRMSLPIIRQTLENYRSLGPQNSFSGPFIRGDAETVAMHLALLKKRPYTRAVYLALGRAALTGLPVKNRKEVRRLLDEETRMEDW